MRLFLVVSLLLLIMKTDPAQAQTSPKDSAALNATLRKQTFEFLMQWRYRWWTENGDLAFDHAAWELSDNYRNEYDRPLPRDPISAGDRPLLDSLRANDPMVEDHDALAKRALEASLATERLGYFSVRGGISWFLSYKIERLDPRSSIDQTFVYDSDRVDLKKLRKPLLTALDGAARKVPGDRWIAAQRVRMHVDQGELPQAIAATRECKGQSWWCMALRGYVWYTASDMVRANAVFDSTLRVAPDSVVCAWNDVSILLLRAAAQWYRQLSCAEQAPINARVWWLADPLFLEPGNARRAEHYGRVMLLTLHTMVDSVDGLFDYRDRPAIDGRYEGSTVLGRVPMQQRIIRFGLPVTSRGCNPLTCKDAKHEGPRYIAQPGPRSAPVQKPRRFDTKDVYLGDYADYAWLGPQYHTLPSWAAIVDPFTSVESDWNLGPQNIDATNWDDSWTAPEVYSRPEGPLFDLPTQVAFFRRDTTAMIAAAAEWDTAATFRPPPSTALFGLAVSSGPSDPLRVAANHVSGRAPPPIFTPIPSRPAVLGIEMIPIAGGAAARVRFGATPPPSLSALAATDIALSDPVLARVGETEDAPTTLAATLSHMYGTTTLTRPSRLAIVWEVYGQSDRDTVDVSLRIVRKAQPGTIQRLLSAVGIGQSRQSDSLVISWREPRRGDGAPLIDGGKTIRLRSIVLDVSAFAEGAYSLEIVTARPGTAGATARRSFVIAR